MTSTSTTHEPPSFHGKESENANDWLTYVDKYAVYKKLDEAAILRYFPLILRDTASDWFDGLRPDVKTTNWQRLKSVFTSQFAPREITQLRDAANLTSSSTTHEPPSFHGKESENANDWLTYVDKYAR